MKKATLIACVTLVSIVPVRANMLSDAWNTTKDFCGNAYGATTKTCGDAYNYASTSRPAVWAKDNPYKAGIGVALASALCYYGYKKLFKKTAKTVKIAPVTDRSLDYLYHDLMHDPKFIDMAKYKIAPQDAWLRKDLEKMARRYNAAKTAKERKWAKALIIKIICS